MYSPPFHRRILPWIFAAAFLASAPVLVFYTAGYRWNPKKEKVERNGTLIIDSTPTGASISLNGKQTLEQTPVTIQNLRPGMYSIRVEKPSYLPWEKTLEVESSLVAFATDIWLWKKGDPTVFPSPTTTFTSFRQEEQLPAPPPTFSVVYATGTGESYLSDSRETGRVFLLPNGSWNIRSRHNGRVILQDGNNWLSVDLQSENPAFLAAKGDRLRPFNLRNRTAYLLVDGGEIWAWDPSRDPELLLRQSGQIVQAAWHRSGDYIFFATETEISALQLDPRNGRLRTTLTSFERISDITVRERDILILGTKDGREAVWQYALE